MASLAFLAHLEHHVDNRSVGLLAGFVVGSAVVLQSEHVEGEQTHGVGEFLQVVGRDLELVVDELVHQVASLEERA